MSNDSEKKITSPLANRLATDGDWSQAAVDRTEEVSIHVHVRSGSVEAVMRAIESAGGQVTSRHDEELFAAVPAEAVFTVANSPDVRLIDRVYEARELAIPDDQISEGQEIANLDDVHGKDLTGEGVTIAVIDVGFDTTNPKFGPDGRDQILDTAGYSGAFNDGQSGQHGTGSTEIVSDMAPDADILLVGFDEPSDFSSYMTTIREDYDVDAVSMSLGFPPSTRIDGRDPYSKEIKKFTDNGNLFATAAGNEANGPTWDGPWRDTNGNGKLEFDDQGTEELSVFGGPELFVHWDDDWQNPSNNFALRALDSSGNVVDEATTTGPPYQVVQVGSADSVEVERLSGSDTDLHFDAIGWGTEVSPSTSERSIAVPATSRYDDTLTVAAVQATNTGRMQPPDTSRATPRAGQRRTVAAASTSPLPRRFPRRTTATASCPMGSTGSTGRRQRLPTSVVRSPPSSRTTG